jgi:hypothetical protein
MNRYKVLLPLQVDTREGGSFHQGDEFETEFTEAEEQANVASGLLEIVPARYRVIGDSRVFDTNRGDEFEAPLTLGQERLLVEGGHIERLDTKTATKKARTKKEETN